MLQTITHLHGCTQGGGTHWSCVVEELKENPAAPMETSSLRLCSSVLLNPASIMTSRSSVLVAAHTLGIQNTRWFK